MAMKKAELESHQASYHALVEKSRIARQNGQYAEALEAALESWEHIDGLIQHERRFGNGQIDGVDGLGLVLDIAPLLFDFESLERFELFLKSNRRIERTTSIDWRGRLAEARLLMREGRELWERIENGHFVAARAQANSELSTDALQSIVHSWAEIGVIRSDSTGATSWIQLLTDFESPTSAKCPSCGAVAKAPKAKFFEEQSCPRCHRKVAFVLLFCERVAST